MTSPVRRPWWRKKRWAAALALWLTVAYPLSGGPSNYLIARGWLPRQAAWVVYAPLRSACRTWPALGEWLSPWSVRWHTLGLRHNIEAETRERAASH